MKICHLTLNQLDLERRILNQAESAYSKKWQVVIIAHGQHNQPKQQLLPFGTLNRVTTGWFQAGPLKFVIFNIKLFWVLLIGRYSIVHCHDLWTLPAAALISYFSRFRLIYDAHEFYAGLEIFTHRKIRKSLWMFAEKLFIKSAAAVITVSEPIGILFRKRYPDLKHVYILRNLPKSQRVEATKLKSPNHQLVFHGHFKPGRGLKNLFLALRDTEAVELTLIGGGELKENLIELSRSQGLNSRIHFKDYIPPDELVAFIAQFDIGIVLFQPSSLNYAHALPNKLFEYLMAGLPVLASNIDTLSAYINQFDFGITVDPDDVRAITEGIQTMITAPVKMKNWHQNALSASEVLNWEQEEHKLIEIYGQITD